MAYLQDLEDIKLNTNKFGPQRQLISQLISTNGDGTGTSNFIGDYSGGLIASIAPPAGTVYRIARMLVSIVDTGSVNDGSKYGNITITSGISIQLHDAHGEQDLTPGNIVTTFDWGSYCYDVNVTDFVAGSNYYQSRWTFEKSGQMIRLDGDEGHELHIHFGDDFTGLEKHTFLIQGYIE